MIHSPKQEFIASRPYFAKAEIALRNMEADLGRGSRWGETRRFAGRSAGLRLERMAKARARWSKAYDRAEKEWGKTTGDRA